MSVAPVALATSTASAAWSMWLWVIKRSSQGPSSSMESGATGFWLSHASMSSRLPWLVTMCQPAWPSHLSVLLIQRPSALIILYKDFAGLHFAASKGALLRDDSSPPGRD